MPASSPPKTPSPSKSRKVYTPVTPSSRNSSPSKSSSPSKPSPSPRKRPARGSSLTYSGTYYGPNTRKACKEWANPRRPTTPPVCPQGHVGFVHLFVGMSQAQAGRWGALVSMPFFYVCNISRLFTPPSCIYPVPCLSGTYEILPDQRSGPRTETREGSYRSNTSGGGSRILCVYIAPSRLMSQHFTITALILLTIIFL